MSLLVRLRWGAMILSLSAMAVPASGQDADGMQPVPLGQGAPQQAEAGPRMRLGAMMETLQFVDLAAAKAKRAQALAGRSNFEAILEYEALITTGEALPESGRRFYEFDVVMASAHLEAARLRLAYGAGLKGDLRSSEQNKAIILQHADKVPSYVVDAMRSAKEAGGAEAFRCQAMKMLGEGGVLRGLAAGSPSDLHFAVETYEKVAACDPESRKNARAMISYIKGVERDLSAGLLHPDNMVKVVTRLIEVSVPELGNFLSAGIDLAYKFYKNSRHLPEPPR